MFSSEASSEATSAIDCRVRKVTSRWKKGANLSLLLHSPAQTPLTSHKHSHNASSNPILPSCRSSCPCPKSSSRSTTITRSTHSVSRPLPFHTSKNELTDRTSVEQSRSTSSGLRSRSSSSGSCPCCCPFRWWRNVR